MGKTVNSTKTIHRFEDAKDEFLNKPFELTYQTLKLFHKIG
jgi:hypothetical protein